MGYRLLHGPRDGQGSFHARLSQPSHFPIPSRRRTPDRISTLFLSSCTCSIPDHATGFFFITSILVLFLFHLTWPDGAGFFACALPTSERPPDQLSHSASILHSALEVTCLEARPRSEDTEKMVNSQGTFQNGPPNGGYMQPQVADQRSMARPFTLPEALPYSPQTSVIPFTPDLIPEPTLGSGSLASSISHMFNSQEYDSLNKEATGQNQNHGLKHLKYAVDHVLHDLKPNQRTYFKFKTVPKPNTNIPSSSVGSPQSLSAGLSPVAKMVFDRAPTFIKPLTGTSGPSSVNGQVAHQPPQPPSTPKSAPPPLKQSSASAEAHRGSNFRFEVAIPSKKFDPKAYVDVPDQAVPLPATVNPSDVTRVPTPTQVNLKQETPPPLPQHQSEPLAQSDTTQPSSAGLTSMPPPKSQTPGGSDVQKTSFAIELPRAPGFNKEEYLEMAVPDSPDEPLGLSMRRQDGAYQSRQDDISTNLNQRQRAETALQDLERLIKAVFDSIRNVLGNEPGHEQVATLNSDNEAILTGSTQQKLQTAIAKAIDLGSYDQASIEDLQYIQKLSEAGLTHTLNLDFRIEESWGESDVTSWLSQLPDIEMGLKTARTCLRIMCGGREEKQIYSEEIIQKSTDVFKGVVEGIVIPVVEMRGSGSSSALFKLLQPHKKAIGPVLTNCQKLFALLAKLVTSIELSDTALGTLEFAASSLLFVDNAYLEKDSVVGVQRFDGIRLTAMEMLCQIFLAKPEQRRGIFDDILTSLEKLPVGKQSARQFRLSNGGSIQPVSALIMRLVQASSGKVDEKGTRSRLAMMADDDADGDEEMTQPGKQAVAATIKSEEAGASQYQLALEELKAVALPLTEASTHNANYVVNFMVNRALKSTKSGDTPYRNLLDLFVEDFTECLDSPDWPSAELILRQMTFYMMKLWEGDRTAAPAKNMALELLGVMSAAVSKLRSHVRKITYSMEGSDSNELSRYLSDLATSALEQKTRIEHDVSWSGPYRTALEHLQRRSGEDPHLQGAISFLIADWAHRIFSGYDAMQETHDSLDQEFGRLAFRLRMMIEDRRWLSNEYTFKDVTNNHAKLAHSIILLRSPFCEHFQTMLNVLLNAMASDQATVRSKSLKSINQLLETDPAILDGDSVVVRLIITCSSDSSPQVRDSAIGLMGKCIGLRPRLEDKMAERIIERFIDSGIGVRKRAMKLARDIYLRNQSREIRSAIANGLLHRVQDPDEGVRELARQMIEEVWFAPFYQVDDTAAFKTSLTDHVALMIQTVKSGNVGAVLDKVLQSILGGQNKAHNGPFGVSMKLVEKMFELIDNLDSDDPAIPSGRDALQVLQIFAKADPKLFTFEEIRLLKPHLGSISGADDLAVFKAVTVIYRQVLPQLSNKYADFLREVREQLQNSVGRLSKNLLDDVVACLWIIADLLDNRDKLAYLGASSLRGVASMRNTQMDATKLMKFARYSTIVGMVGKHCDLDSEIDVFKKIFPKYSGTSVAKLMVDNLSPWADASQLMEARKHALDAIGLICQAHPRNYVSPNVYTKFQQVFEARVPALESTILRSFKEFLVTEEKRSEAATAAAVAGPEGDKKRELTVMGGTNYDDVASATTQRFLKEITRIALSSQDEHAFLAVEVLGSINRQGLVHPKETGVTLITLETSSMTKISEVAFMEHRALHEKHETVIEREYVRAIQAAYEYQRDIVKDTRGATTNPFQSKLHLLMEVLKVSKSKNRQKFLEKLVFQVDFDSAKLDVSAAFPPHVEYARFMIENLAYFEYVTVGEVLVTVHAMEKLFSTTGPSMAHVIESDIFNVRMDMDKPDDLQGDGQPTQPQLTIPPKRLRQLTSGSIILLCLWEARTYLRRLYGLGSKRETKTKLAAKDLSKAPTKVQGVTGDKFWEEVNSHMNGLTSQEATLEKCKTFVELMNVDKEFKVADEEDLDGEDAGTPSEGEDDGLAADGRGRKRKAGSLPGNRKKRARSSSRPRPRGRPRKNPNPAEVEDDADGDFDDMDFV
ncbi:Putative armadillo-like helical, sister chromatid cohesion domain, Scc2/Nipped-B family [Colletotrichum destructivum]|uniref:Sister chromatid cohesion protein n=1 Tax=Colletotrichum destructivum TaxID=34406 RepID=A0AAX4IRZ6_9PEZI|nr:Putative armadillo-like helical, sister chromatid cohesion domain, Scc2/Nipped-B family [Colletotrichum destructivum]